MVGFSDRSTGFLNGVDPRLVQVLNLAKQKSGLPFEISEGRRTTERQRELLAAGKSQTMNSRHIHGNAVDVHLLNPDGSANWDFESYRPLAAAMKSAAQELGYNDLVWGGDWKTLKDGVHFQIGGPEQAASPGPSVIGGGGGARVVQGDNISGGAGSPSLLGSEGSDMANEQQRGGFLARQRQAGGLLGEGGILSPDRRDRLVMGLEGMTLNPNRALQAAAAQGIQQRAKGRETTAQQNKTAEFLRQRANGDPQIMALADAVEAGQVDPQAAVKSVLTPKKDTTPDAFRTLDLRAQAAGLQPGTPEYAEFFARGGKPAEAVGMVTQITGADLIAKHGLAPGKIDPDALYNVSEKGNVTRIDGGGDTFNIGAGETAFTKETGKLLAVEANDIAQQGASAQRNLGRIATLEQALANSPEGAAASIVQMASGLGIKTAGSSDIEVANAIISQLVPEQRPPGSGTMSDSDLALFKASLPQLINTREGNRKILETMRAIAGYDIERGRIARRQQIGEISPQQAFDAYAALGNPLADFVKAANAASPAGGAPTGAGAGVATHRLNPQTGQVEPIK